MSDFDSHSGSDSDGWTPSARETQTMRQRQQARQRENGMRGKLASMKAGRGGFGRGGRRGGGFGGGGGPMGAMGGGKGMPMLLMFGGILFVGMKLMNARNKGQGKKLPKAFIAAHNQWQTDVVASDDVLASLVVQREMDVAVAGHWNKSTNRFKKVSSKYRRRRHLVDTVGSRYAVLPNFLSAEECEELIALGQGSAGIMGAHETSYPMPGGNGAGEGGMVYRTNTTVAGGGASQTMDAVVKRIEEKIQHLTRIPPHPHEPGLSVSAKWSERGGAGASAGAGEDGVEQPQQPPWSLTHGVGISPFLVVTVRIYLSGAAAGDGGGALLFPTMGLNDRKMYNATQGVFEDPAHEWNLQATEGSAGGAYERAMRSKNIARAMQDPVGICKAVGASRSRKAAFKKSGILAAAPRRGIAVMYYSRMKMGIPDPDAWFMECPTINGVSWIAEKHKYLPITSDGTWDFSVFNTCQDGENCN